MKRAEIAALMVLAFTLATSTARASTLYVANNGVDSSSCGAQLEPCRSIGQAISRANVGDTILVGPGLYGNLTDLFNYLASGEEQGGAACGGNRGEICVDKRLTIQSIGGAAATVISETNGMTLLSDGIVVGGEGKGFTFAHSGIWFPPGTSGNSVSGSAVSSAVVIEGNSHTFAHNTVGAGTAYTSAGSSLRIRGSGHFVDQNVLTNSAITLDGVGQAFVGNVVIKSSPIDIGRNDSGTTPVTSGVIIQGNTFVGNIDDALYLYTGASATINRNNIFGNTTNVSPLNCAVHNQSGNAIDATNNFWGASSGPGPEPADDVCNDAGSSTTVIPFATQQFAAVSSGSGSGNGSPVCNAAQAVPVSLWPANGRFTSVSVVGVGDPDNDPVTISITGVTQDEAVVSPGVGDSRPDAVLHGSSADVRAQRLAAGDGRVYQLKFSATDGHGGSCTGTVSVGVSNSQKPGQAIVDSGQLYDSTQP